MGKITRNVLSVTAVLVLFLFQATAADNKDKEVAKSKEVLAKAFEQKDAAKKSEMISKAREGFQKAGLKPQEIAVIMGDAYLDKGDLQNAASQYGSASKEDKKEGLKKVADAYVETAFNGDEKAETKAINKAMDYYRKADALKEGARGIGDKYYAKGASGYNKALEYYIIGGSDVKIEQMAKEYFDKGGENVDKAAGVYMKLKTPVGYKKAGDIYYDEKEYQKAIDAYQAGNVVEGIKKYAEHLYATNRNEEADNLIVKIAEILATEKNDEALEKLASDITNKGSYGLASRIYDKAGNTTMSDKSKGYAELVNLNLDAAKALFTNVNDMAMVKNINDNVKTLTALKDIGENFDEVMKGAPFVNMIVDSVTGQSSPSQSDQKTLEDYYKSVREQIIKNTFDVSANMAKLTTPDLKKYVRIRFMKYGAVRKILDTETFAIKKQKADIKVKDVVL